MTSNPLVINPTQQIGRYLLTRLPDVSLPGGSAVQLAPENAQRVALYVQPLDPDQITVTPAADATWLNPRTVSITLTPVAIHIATYSLLTLGAWYATSAIATTVAVWEVSER